ncbi:MAG: hypothetical protein B2I18_04000 [Cuniculiplasma sp. C_DKE]|uniref:Uncharacterized protein n=1 Tax=Cuniculiplasma divulgatum TaxID=1673428 RepID=A0A1N5UJ41_9ARCH|nr:MAG: hypothetical protein B2I18_04000 [Cuniculiplasma sp. C_DKE]SIM60278.1 hypothetical protein CSP5_0973 [Cuniculiplasma divulgatum]
MKITDEDDLPNDIKKNIHSSDKNKEKNILWIMLSKPIVPKAYCVVFLNYIEYARRTDDNSKAQKGKFNQPFSV